MWVPKKIDVVLSRHVKFTAELKIKKNIVYKSLIRKVLTDVLNEIISVERKQFWMNEVKKFEINIKKRDWIIANIVNQNLIKKLQVLKIGMFVEN